MVRDDIHAWNAGQVQQDARDPGIDGGMRSLDSFRGLPIWAIASVAVIGTIAADKYEKAVEREDPPEVVIDEVAGCWIACWGFEPTYAIVGLFLFRIIDITKPFPVREMERLPGGIGIMADDIAGGIMANLLLRAMTWLFFGGGMETILGLVGK